MYPVRLWALERFYGSPLLRRALMALQRRRAERALGRGLLLPAAHALLRGWKHAGDEALGEAGRRLWGRILHAAREPDGSLRPAAGNPFRLAWAATEEAREQRARFASYPPSDRVRLRSPRPEAPAARQGDLILLKEPGPAPGEQGVLLITYHHGIAYFPMVYDLSRLAGRYVVVLEPSTWGYMDARFLPYLGSDLDVVVEAQSRPDFEWVRDLGTNLVPSRLGAGDWADPALFAPASGGPRAYDVCMVSAWDPLKRHALLLDVLARLKRRGRPLKVALVGYRLDWTQEHVERLARRRGVRDLLTFFDRIPHAEVARLLADARVSVLLSRREGANRAIYESWFCDTPTIVYRHHRGVNLEHAADPRLGLLADERELEAALLEALGQPERFSPRERALATTGCHVATARLEQELRALAGRRGRPFTRGLAVRHAAGYLHEADRLRLAGPTEALAEHLLPA